MLQFDHCLVTSAQYGLEHASISILPSIASLTAILFG
jgi:hypothetical protein